MKRYQDIIGRINYWLFLAVVALLPFPQILLRYACVLWVICWALEGRWLRKPKSLRENKMAIPFILFGLWYAYKMLSGLWVDDLGAWRWQMERYMSFLLIVPIGIWGLNERYEWTTIGKVLVGSCIVAVPLYLGWMGLLYHHEEWVQHIRLHEPWAHHAQWWPFLSENISHFKHRLFLCSIELFGAIIAFILYRKRPLVLIPSLIVMLSVIPLSGSRQSILTCAALLVAGIISSMPKRYRLRYGVGILLLGIVLGGGLLLLHPRMQQFNLNAIKEMRSVSYEHDVRFNIWGIALQHPEDYLAHGLGAGQSTNYMVEHYRQYQLDYYIQKQYHPHNQYLEELMDGGILGLLLFLIAWASIPICAQGKGHQTAVLFTTLFCMNMLTDCMFGKFDGIVLWMGGMILIYQINRVNEMSFDRLADA